MIYKIIVHILALGMLLIIGLSVWRKWSERRRIKSLEQQSKELEQNAQKMRAMGLKPFERGGRTIWAKSFKEANALHQKEINN